jgi:hypothetical protein
LWKKIWRRLSIDCAAGASADPAQLERIRRSRAFLIVVEIYKDITALLLPRLDALVEGPSLDAFIATERAASPALDGWSLFGRESDLVRPTKHRTG